MVTKRESTHRIHTQHWCDKPLPPTNVPPLCLVVAFQQPFELNVVLNGVMPDGSVTHISNNVHQKSRTLHCIDVSVHGESLPLGFFFIWTGCKILLIYFGFP